MPTGELYIKTSRITSSSDTTGVVTDSTDTFYGYADAYLRYGLSLCGGAIDKLVAPVGKKDPQGNKSALSPGVGYLGMSVGITDEREVSVDMVLNAPNKTVYLQKLAQLRHEVMDLPSGEYFMLRTNYFPDEAYRVIYKGCEPFRSFCREMALFTMILREPHPELRSLSLT